MNWDSVYTRLQGMKGARLRSISGRSDIVLVDVDPERITVRTPRGSQARGTHELKRVVRKMDLMTPIHVDSLLLGSGSSRNQPETILANLPDVEWVHLNRCKHIVWVGRETHQQGTLNQLDTYNTAQMRTQYAGRGPVTGQTPITALVMACEVRAAGDILSALLQVQPQALPSGNGYRISSESSTILLLPSPGRTGPEIETIPALKVVDREEAVDRARSALPNLSVESIDAGRELTVLRWPDGGAIALED